MNSLFSIKPLPKTLADIHAKWKPCRKCFFSHQYPKGPCLPNGAVGANILIVGQWPGQEDMMNGVPFSGPQGKICKDMLHKAGFVEAELFYTNVLMCTCPAQPSKDVIENCKDQLDEVISVKKPKMIICLGMIAAKRLGEKDGPGVPFEYKGIVTIPCTHPAAIARAKGKEEKARLTETIRGELDTARRVYLHGND